MLTVLSIAWDSICSHRRSVLAVVLICSFAVFLTSIVIANSVSLSESEHQYSKAIVTDHDNTLFVKPLHSDMNTAFMTGWEAFLTGIRNVDGCSAAGASFYDSIYETNGSDPKDRLAVLFIDEEILDLCDTSLSEQEKKSLTEYGEVIPLMVGADYAAKYPMGSEIETQDRKYRIVGTLSKSSVWVTEGGISHGREQMDLSNCFVTASRHFDNPVLYGMNGIYVILDSKTDAEEVKNRISSFAGECGIDVSVKTVREYISKVQKAKRSAEKELLIELAIVFLVAIISASTINIVCILLRKREIGILYSCGYSRGDIMKSLISEAGIKALLCLGAWWIGQALASRWNMIDIMSLAGESKGLFLFLLIVLVFVLFGATTLCSGVYLVRRSPIEMLEDWG